MLVLLCYRFCAILRFSIVVVDGGWKKIEFRLLSLISQFFASVSSKICSMDCKYYGLLSGDPLSELTEVFFYIWVKSCEACT